jgi:putative transposase
LLFLLSRFNGEMEKQAKTIRPVFAAAQCIVGWVRFFKSREITGAAKNVTVSRRGEYWFVSIQTEQQAKEPIHPSSTIVGIDMGVKRFATLSDGTYIEPLSSFRRLEHKLAKQQRKLSRKVRGSNNWCKQKVRIARTHISICLQFSDQINEPTL